MLVSLQCVFQKQIKEASPVAESGPVGSARFRVFSRGLPLRVVFRVLLETLVPGVCMSMASFCIQLWRQRRCKWGPPRGNYLQASCSDLAIRAMSSDTPART